MLNSNPDNSKIDQDERGAILVVDDERGPRESLRMILSAGHRVITAESGSQALEVLHSEEIDLVTVHLMLHLNWAFKSKAGSGR